MKIICEKTLDLFRTPRTCEHCLKPCKPDPHHLWAKGMGGGGRIDLRINICALCRTCHTELHAGKIEPLELLLIVARRERVPAWAIDAVIYLVRRLRKDATKEAIWEAIELLDEPASRMLARRELAELLQ